MSKTKNDCCCAARSVQGSGSHWLGAERANQSPRGPSSPSSSACSGGGG
eukprot:CAMPEP_0197448184 /NCGR_PEP_ID=MMETSP1175-20131217/16408_1 /TAXON_ID=1003142 /ORGANISM="Triceratium dubium, Strain CCMP147" /LENGTH=48 /DNA_ID= /DNA_START= /DNA_END= /DNA_ORIENTATION=